MQKSYMHSVVASIGMVSSWGSSADKKCVVIFLNTVDGLVGNRVLSNSYKYY